MLSQYPSHSKYEVLTRKVFIDTVIIKFEQMKVDIVEYKYTYMDGNVKVDRRFGSFNFIATIW